MHNKQRVSSTLQEEEVVEDPLRRGLKVLIIQLHQLISALFVDIGDSLRRRIVLRMRLRSFLDSI